MYYASKQDHACMYVYSNINYMQIYCLAVSKYVSLGYSIEVDGKQILRVLFYSVLCPDIKIMDRLSSANRRRLDVWPFIVLP